MHAFRSDANDPVFLNSCPPIQRTLVAQVVLEASVRNFDDQPDIASLRPAILVTPPGDPSNIRNWNAVKIGNADRLLHTKPRAFPRKYIGAPIGQEIDQILMKESWRRHCAQFSKHKFNSRFARLLKDSAGDHLVELAGRESNRGSHSEQP